MQLFQIKISFLWKLNLKVLSSGLSVVLKIIYVNHAHFQSLLHKLLLMLQLLTGVSLSIRLIPLALLGVSDFVRLIANLSLMLILNCLVLPAFKFLSQTFISLLFYNLKLKSYSNYFNFISYLVFQFIKLNCILRLVDWYFNYGQNLRQCYHHNSNW